MKFTLNHLTGSCAGATQELVGQVITVGRDPSNVLAFDPNVDAAVSGFHASLTVQGAQVFLSDLGSSNGTLVNGARIQGMVPLVSGATVQFGDKGPIVSVQFAPVAGSVAGGQVAGASAPGAGGASGVAAGGGASGAPLSTAGAPAGGPAAGGPAGAGAPPPAGAAGPSPAGAPAAPGAESPAGAAPPAADTAKPPKPPVGAKLKSCGISAIASVLVTLLVGGVCYAFRAQLQQSVPQGLQTHLRKIPGVKLIFSKAKAPTSALPAGARDAGRMLPKGDKSDAPSEESKSE